MGATQKEHRLLKQLLSDSIVRVCETSLGHSGCFSVDALVGVQLGDGRVFIVNLHKSHSATKLVNTASADDDDVTSLDMHVDEIADVKQEPSTETAGQIGGERRSERLKKKRTVSRKSGSSRSAAKSSRKKLALAGGTRRARQTTDTFEKLQDVGDLTNCATSVGADVKHSEYNNYLNDDIDRATSPRDRSSTAPDDGTSDGTSERAIAELTSDELSRYDIDVGRNRRGTEGTDGDVAVVSDDVVKWTCHVCGYSSAHRNNFERHLFLHNLTPDGKSHMCSECGKRCRDAHELRTHVSVKHRKLLFRCARCGDGGKAFQSQKALRYHVATKHTGEFRYRCAVCDKTFLYVAHYRTHMNVHDGVRQLCAYCGKQFNYRASLKKHMDACEARRHDTATPPPVDFRCEHCDRTFRSRSYLTDHVHTRHLRTRRYACTACGAAFLYRTGLARHRAKCANSAPGDGLGASGDGSELAARSQEEATFVDLLADVGTDVGLISAALRYVSHNTGQLTTHDDVTTTLDVPAAVTSLSTTASVGVTSPDDLLSTTVNQTVASPDDVLITTAAMTVTSPDDVLSTTVAQTVASPGDLLSTTAGQTVTSPDDVLSTTVAQTVASPDDMLSADSLQYVTAVCCPPTERQCTAETCVEALQQCSVTQLFDSCSDSTLRTLHLGGVASSHQDGVASAMTVAPPGNNIG